MESILLPEDMTDSELWGEYENATRNLSFEQIEFVQKELPLTDDEIMVFAQSMLLTRARSLFFELKRRGLH